MLIEDMKACEQTKGLSVYQHGEMVLSKTLELLEDKSRFRLPRMDFENACKNLHPKDVVSRYTLMHDCGKPYCRTELDGKVHFPDHARVSEEVYRLNFPNDETVAKLIGWDMDLHTLSAKEIDDRMSVWSPQDACTLMIVTIAEIHANAEMFGGIESQSFKQKLSKLDRRCNQISKILF